MSEKTPSQNNEYNKRPIGRFLLSRSQELVAERFNHKEAYEFTKSFFQQYGDELHSKGISAIAHLDISSEDKPVYGGKDYIWLEFDHRYVENDCYVWKLCSGMEHFDLVLSSDYYMVTSYELSEMNLVLRRKTEQDPKLANKLQMFITSLLTNEVVQNDIEQKRIKKQLQQDSYNQIIERSKNQALSVKDSRNLETLKKTKDSPIFDAGFTDRRDKVPLLGQHDWKPAVIYP